MNMFNESEELVNALTPIVKKIINEQTGSCLRTYKAVVVKAPNINTKKCVVRLAGQETNLSLPYSSSVSAASAGDMVWVATTYNSFKNAVVWQLIDFK